ncbi:MAG: hypothetical protein HWE16_10345 [Gammaproteobacteria bacterium]|nr:hypothetical protein [Gammaproteobacteria bacterium]
MKKSIFAQSIAALSLATACFAASANDKLSYNYFQFGLVHSAGELTSDKSGYNFDISLDWTESLYLRTTYNTQSADVWAGGQVADVDASEYSLNLGFHTAMTRSTDLIAEVGYLKQDAEGLIPQSTYGNDEDGFQVKLGARTRWNANWESSLFAGYKDVDFSPYVNEALHEDDDTIFGAEIRYYLNKTWSLGLTVGEEAAGETSQLTLRANF